MHLLYDPSVFLDHWDYNLLFWWHFIYLSDSSLNGNSSQREGPGSCALLNLWCRGYPVCMAKTTLGAGKQMWKVRLHWACLVLLSHCTNQMECGETGGVALAEVLSIQTQTQRNGGSHQQWLPAKLVLGDRWKGQKWGEMGDIWDSLNNKKVKKNEKCGTQLSVWCTCCHGKLFEGGFFGIYWRARGKDRI